jgi:hypothetical protein
MSQSADALDRYQVAGARTGIPQGVEDRDASAKQRSSLVRRQIVGHQRDPFSGCNHVFRVASIKVNRGDLFNFAIDEVAAAAPLAYETMPAVPAHTNALTGPPKSYVGTNGIDAPGDLMPRHTRILNTRPESFFHQRIAVTDAARFYLDTNLATAWLRDWALDDFEISTWLAVLNGFHGGTSFNLEDGE